MKNDIDDESEDLPQKIMQEIKSVYDKYKNTVIKQFQSKFDNIKIKQFQNRFDNIKINLDYKKFKENRVSTYNKYKDIVVNQFQNKLDSAKSNLVYKKFKGNRILTYYNKYKGIVVEQFRNKLGSTKINLVCEKFKENRKLICKVIGGVIVSLSLATFVFLKINNSYIAYSVEVDDSILAVVRDEDNFINALEEVKKEALSLYGQEAVLDKEPVFIKTKAKKEKITQYEEMIKNIKSQFDIKLKAAVIKVDGEELIVVKDDKTAFRILDSIKDFFIGEKESEYDCIDFVEKVEVVETAVDFSDIMDEEEALRLITIGTDEEKIHEIEKGENTWTIALKYGLKMDDIMKANPGIDSERLQIGQKISLIVPKPLISVKTKEYIEFVEGIPFETEYEQTDVLYKGDKKIIVHGEEGKREIKGYAVKENGVEVDREIIEEKILSEPKTRVVAEGTKARPATMATGFFVKPTRGRLTSSFGMRRGRRHTGIDIAASRGTPIYAADAGRVSFSGRKGTYGNLIIIDHENGYQTYYAHNNRNLVKRGQRVYKGQKIAEMGSTGRSTGVHLHFEVRKNGTPINPKNFVKY